MSAVAKIVRAGKVGQAKVANAEVAQVSKQATVKATKAAVKDAEVTTVQAKTTVKTAPATGTKQASPKAAAKTAPAKAAAAQAAPAKVATPKAAPAKAKAAVEQATEGAAPYWQYTRAQVEGAFAILVEADFETIELVAELAAMLGTKATMALVRAAANGEEPNVDRLMKGRE